MRPGAVPGGGLKEAPRESADPLWRALLASRPTWAPLGSLGQRGARRNSILPGRFLTRLPPSPPWTRRDRRTRMAQPSRRKVAMIGLDALDFDRVQAALADLPALRRLFERGRVCPLTSPATHLTSAVWPTFATGRPPGHHGIYYPMQWDPATMSLRRVSAEWLPFEPFWYGLERHGVRTTVLDVPFSLPSRLEVGTEVANWGSQECLGPLSSNRPEIVRAIRARFGRHPMGEEIPVAPTRARLERLRRDLLAGVDRKAELARHLMRETDWDLFVTVFAEPHRAGHSLWPLPGELGAAVPDGALAEVERAVDAALGKVLAGIEARSTAIVVFSVHGM